MTYRWLQNGEFNAHGIGRTYSGTSSSSLAQGEAEKASRAVCQSRQRDRAGDDSGSGPPREPPGEFRREVVHSVAEVARLPMRAPQSHALCPRSCMSELLRVP